jgi:hypothetical protein
LKQIFPGKEYPVPISTFMCLNVEIGAEAALFPEKEYINGIAVAVRWGLDFHNHLWTGKSVETLLKKQGNLEENKCKVICEGI